MKGRDASLRGKCRVGLGEVAGGARQRLGVAGRPVRECNRLVEEPGVFRRGEPLALVAGCLPNDVGQEAAGGLCGYFFATARNHAR